VPIDAYDGVLIGIFVSDVDSEELIDIDVWIAMRVNVLVDELSAIVIGIASCFEIFVKSVMAVLEFTMSASEGTTRIFLDC